MCLQQQAALPPLAWAALLACVPLAFFIRHAGIRKSLLLGAAFGAGFFWAAGFAAWRLADALPGAWEGKDIQVVGVVAALPQFSERRVRFEFDVEQVLTPQARVPRHIQLFWFTHGTDDEDEAHVNPSRLHAGERWRFTLRLKRPHGAVNPYGFDYEAWLLEQNIRATGYIRKDPGNVRLNQFVLAPGYLIERVRDAVAQRLKRVLQDDS